LLCGREAAESPPVAEIVALLAQEVYSNDLLQLLVIHISKLDFEVCIANTHTNFRPANQTRETQAKKDVAQIFNNLLRRQIGTRSPTVEYLGAREQILFDLLKGYDNPDVALNCGMILRECIRHESLAKLLLHSPNFYLFFDYVDTSTFDIASDAFTTFKVLDC